MDDELSRGVGLGAGEGDEALPGQGPEQVLDLRRARAPGGEALGDEALVLLGLAQVADERLGEVGIAGELGRRAHLGECLLLDRVGVGQVLRQLVLERVRAHRRLPVVCLERSPGSAPGKPTRRPGRRSRPDPIPANRLAGPVAFAPCRSCPKPSEPGR
jgi:hypothetical protein